MWPSRGGAILATGMVASSQAGRRVGGSGGAVAMNGATATDHPLLSPGIVTALVLLGVGYNALLALVNAHVTSLTITQVAACEFLLLFITAVAVWRTGVGRTDTLPLALAITFVLVTLFLSLINAQPIVAPLRNCAIIVLFTMVGARCNARTIRLVFTVVVSVVFVVMLFELLAVKSYVAVFQPHSYFLNTRGLGEDTTDDSGLFPNALGFADRFSFGLFSTPRTSSIFLEQTSLANFASVVMIYLITLWGSLNRASRWIGAGFVVVALLSNNTRMASVFALVVLGGYWLFPRLPGRGTFAIPIVLAVLALAMTAILGTSYEDDLAGRIGLSVNLLAITDLPAVLGARAMEADSFPDSGYSYILYSSSVAGALALWFYVASIIPVASPEQRRCAWALALFFFINLIVAGNAVFSIKIAAFLWLLAGFMGSIRSVEMPPGARRRAVHPRRSARSSHTAVAA